MISHNVQAGRIYTLKYGLYSSGSMRQMLSCQTRIKVTGFDGDFVRFQVIDFDNGIKDEACCLICDLLDALGENSSERSE